MQSEVKTPVPGEITVRHLQKHLESEVANWEQLGFYLRVDVDKIQNQSRITPDVCLLKVIKCFLNDGNATWKILFDALKDCGNARLMRELQQTYHADMEVTVAPQDLVSLLKIVTPNWYMFGQSLDIPPSTLKTFKDEKTPDQIFSEVLEEWLNVDPYWEDLVKALIQIGNRRLATMIQDMYIKQVPDDSLKTEPVLWYAGVEDYELEEDSIFDVLSAITKVNRWEDLGLALNIAPSKLEEIKINNREKVSECRKDMLSLWVKSGKASWKNLCLALDSGVVGEPNLARVIAKKHKGPQQALDEPTMHQNISIPVQTAVTEQEDLSFTTASNGPSMMCGVNYAGTFTHIPCNIQTDLAESNISTQNENPESKRTPIEHVDTSVPIIQDINVEHDMEHFSSNSVYLHQATQQNPKEDMVPPSNPPHIIYNTSDYANTAISEIAD